MVGGQAKVAGTEAAPPRTSLGVYGAGHEPWISTIRASFENTASPAAANLCL